MMSVAEARAVLGAAAFDRIRNAPRPPLSQEQIDLLVHAFRSERATAETGAAA